MTSLFPLFLGSILSLKSFALGPLAHERTDTPNQSNATTGRYIYVGDVPKFKAQDLEITLSKMSLTSRVTAKVSQSLIDSYAATLFQRWERIDNALSDSNFTLDPLVRLDSLNSQHTPDKDAWIEIAEQYSKHILETSGEMIYSNYRGSDSLLKYGDAETYKEIISRSILKEYFRQNISPENLRNNITLKNSLISTINSRRLFSLHFNTIFTSQINNEYVGFLTLVYPIAATTAGPFSQPSEKITDLKTSSSIEARWWSDKWQDEFGGFPFLLIEWNGIAFHGPITNYAPLDVWFLRRGYVSHGCHRMDSSDILELRALFPAKLSEAKNIRVTILNYFDVVDWNNDGKKEVVDVKYYNIPTSISVGRKSVDEVVNPYLVKNQMKSFYTKHPYARDFYDSQNDQIKNAPAYQISGINLKRQGTHGPLPLYHFEYRGNRIMQYEEEGIHLKGYDDTSGKYPPVYFQKF